MEDVAGEETAAREDTAARDVNVKGDGEASTVPFTREKVTVAPDEKVDGAEE